MSAAVLVLLLRGNLALSAAIMAILLLRRPIRSQFGAAAGYALWLGAPLCLLVALAPPSAPAGLMAPVIPGVGAAATPQPAPSEFDWRTGLAVAWLLGVVGAAGLFAVRQVRFVRALGRLTPWAQVGDILIGERHQAGPLVLGFLRPRIVLPADFEARFEGEARALVLAHERVHLGRGDALTNGLTVALQCLAWFNPLVHLAARALRVDQEIACDAAVVAARPQSRRLYAETLIGALTAPVSAPLACHWPAVGVHPLKERLVMMSTVSISPRRKALGLGLVAALGLAGAGAVWAANPAPAEVILQPDWVSRPTGADLARFYPAEAAKARTNGLATIACGVAASGRLQDCSVVAESPVAAGFGEAALKLSESFQMRPLTRDGKPTSGGSVRIPIKFALAPEPQA